MVKDQILKISNEIWTLAQILSADDFEKAKPHLEEMQDALKVIDKEMRTDKTKCLTCKHEENADEDYPCNICRYSFVSKYQAKGEEE